MGKFLDRYIQRKALGRWQRAVHELDQAALPELRRQRDEARRLRGQLEQVIQKADSRLVQPLIGANQFSKPLGTDWSWRPDLWRTPLIRKGIASASRKARLDGQVTLFHDCSQTEIGMQQIRNRGDKDLAPFSLAIEVFDFQGSFLSLSVELPSDAAMKLTRQHLIRVETLVECERSTVVIARLNIQHGPNAEQVLRELDLSAPATAVDFDLAHLKLNERRLEKLWLDLIIDQPAMNRVVFRDLTFCRYHRADL
ncbi:hypothetical protein SAMN05444358_102221 [Ruegeria halocynthiae]|uniref:Uncharacterized protein n=1 Tax=Ruegeria halocynthiae TaxID=985054 RepID=A0A1H2YD10_9RHOB|nr:DUF6478 family protein [Ruegeria halocynthiae]SDX02419.1 hypothetical protein SAMN05444358_102221 [Ruegeria halocynthiae]